MTIEADPLRGHGALVDALGSCLRRGDHALGTVPNLLKRILQEGAWREFVTQRGEHVKHKRFVDFVTTPPLKGLGSDVALVRRIVADDPEALDLLDQALQGKHGGDRRSAHATNVDISNVDRPTGTTRDRALRKLRKDAPKLHAEVLAGHLSAHAAMIQAGFRPKTFSVRAGDAESAARSLRKHLPPDELARLAELLRPASGEP